jgi:PAS domain S-box-containing protein
MRTHERPADSNAAGDARLDTLAPALIALTGLVGCAFLFTNVRAGETAAGSAALERECSKRIADARREFTAGLEQLYSVVALFESSVAVVAGEFATFTSGTLERHPALRAIATLASNPDSAPEAPPLVVQHVAGAEATGFGAVVAAGADAELPRAASYARAEDGLGVSAPITSIGAGRPRVVALIPVDEQVLAAIMLDMQALLSDDSAGGAWTLSATDAASGALLTEPPASDEDGITFSQTLHYGGRTWSITGTAPGSALAAHRSLRPWIFAGLGLVATALLALAVATGTSRARIQRLVERRTREVQAAYDTLAHEAEERRLAVAESRRLERQLRETIDLVPNLIYVRDWNGRFLLANRATAEAYGLPVDDLTGPVGLARPAPVSEPGPDLVEERRLMQARLSSVVPAAPFVDAQGKRRIMRTVKIPCDVFGDDTRALLCVATDITEQKHAEESLSGQNRVLRQLASGASLEDVLTGLVCATEEIVPDMRCTVLLLDGVRLHHGAAPSMPDFYNEAIDGLPIGPHAGSCGAAAYSGERVIVENVFEHPNWEPYRELARRAHVSACWSQPIRASDRRIVGTFAMYYSEPRAPEPYEVRLLESAAHLAGLALEREDPPRSASRSENVGA